MKKKKKGSVLLIVVGLFAFMSILIVSVMTMTTTGFKLRKDESARIENFYGADSGIDIAESITVELIDEAIEKGNIAAENQEGNWNEKNKIFREEYAKYIRKNFKKRVDNIQGDGTTISSGYDKYSKEGQPIKVGVEKFDEIIVEKDKNEKVLEGFEVSLKSTFKDEKEKDRAVTVNYTLDIPDYGVETIEKPFVSNGSNLLDYVMATDGNLYINNDIQQGSDLDIYGDMWIGGHEKTNNRYGRGIHLSGDFNTNLRDESVDLDPSRIDIYGKIATKGAINIDNEKVKFHKEVFARDFKISGEKNEIDIKSKGDETKGLYIYNDLIFEGENSNLNLDDYYGLNDLTYINGNLNHIDLAEEQRSSAVIVNSKDFGEKSFITASNMQISGTAYIGGINPMDELKNYQSGESIVINRNTKPYTDRELINSMGEKEKTEYLFKYKNPLHIVDKIYKENIYQDLSVGEKSKIVKEYYKSVKDSEIATNKEFRGVKGPEGSGNLECNIVSTGVSYGNGKVINNVTIPSLAKEQGRFAEEVYLRNTRDVEMPIDFWSQPEEVSVGESINWNAISKIIKKDIISREILDVANKSNKSTKEVVFEKHKIDTSNDYIDSNLGIFKSTMNITEMLGGVIENTDLVDIGSNNIILIFNNTDKEVEITHDGNIPDNNNISVKHKNNVIDIKMNCANNIGVVISKGNISLNFGASGRGYLISLGTRDLSLNSGGSNTYGNFSTNSEALNKAFKEIFKFEELENILGGGDGTGEESDSESNTVVYPSDLIKDKVWNLEK
ncbi:MAG: hypothetical protein ACRC6T_15035 [Sarcina sp.]